MAESKIPDLKQMIASASDVFYQNFQSLPSVCGCAPGRVNLIGEHTDYNNGFVLPMALPMVTIIVGKENGSRTCRLITICSLVDDPKKIEFHIPDEEQTGTLSPGKPSWANYIKGVIANFKGIVKGFDAVIATSVPVGGGLSSSAALEVATFKFLEALFGETSNSFLEKALACQKAEHEFSGTPCGIMDQFISLMGEKDNVLLLDCRSLEHQLIPLKNPDIAVLITNTNVRHKLVDGQYTKRREQCEMATKIIGKSSLREVTLKELQKYQEKLGDEVYHRALHVVSEIERTILAAKALQEENYNLFGILMQESHKSLKENYEVSCEELDTVVNAALEVNGVFGSRMTGGGFGGCSVTLLRATAINETMQNIMEKYEKTPTFYVCHPGNGAQIIQLSCV